MSRPPISRENSSNNLALNQQDTNPQPDKDAKATDQAAKSPPPQLNQKTEENQPKPSGDTGFSKDDWTKHGQGSDEQPAQKQPKEKSSQDDQQKSSGKQADTAPKGKAGSSTGRANVPSLKLGGSETATLKSRPPVSPDSLSALGSHRTMSPRTSDANQPNSSNSSSTPNANTQGQAPSSTPPARSLPPIPQTPSSQTPPVSTSNVPASARSATSAASNEKGMPASQLSHRSKLILDSALINGRIDPTELGNLLVEVQTAGFTSPTSIFSQGKPFLRGGLQVLNFTSSDGQIHDSVNLIEKFLQPLAEKVFNTPECNGLRKTVLKNYLPVASSVETAARGKRPKEMQQSEQIKNLMDPVIKPFTTWICGENENLTSSQLPEAWKSLLLGIDDAVVYWAKNKDCTNMKEIKSLRSEAMIAFISTRGYMMAWGKHIQKYSNEHNIGSEKFSSFLNSYFAHRADKFITDIMLTRKGLAGDEFETKMRGYINVLGGRKELVSKAPKENLSGRRQLMKSRTLQSTKAPPANSSNTVIDESATLSPRMREKIDVDKTRDIKQQQSVYQRQKFFRDFSKLANLAKISPEFFKAFQTHVVNEMSDRAYEKFEQGPVQLCTRYLDKFYVGVLNKERQAAEKSIRAALTAISQKDIDALAPAAEKVKSYVKPDPKVSKERREQFLGNFFFYAGIHDLSRDFLKSFGSYIYELSRTEYVKFEENPIPVCLAYVDKFYSSHVTTTKKVDHDTVAKQKEEFISYLKNISPNSLEGLRKSMATPSKPVSDALDGVKLANVNLEFPENPFEEDEKQAINSPTTTASTQALQDSRTPSSSTVDVKPVQEKEVTGERKNNFLENFISKTEIHELDQDFLASFKNHILGLASIDYLKFEADPIKFCSAYVVKFYSSEEYTSTVQSIAIAADRKQELDWYLNNFSRKNSEAINTLAAASTKALQGSRTPSSSTVDVTPVQENEISADRRNDFLDQFYKLVNIQNISDDFDAAFNKHILGLSTVGYKNFLESPIADCQTFLSQFYALPFHKKTQKSWYAARKDRAAIFFSLVYAQDKNLEAINKLAASNLAPISAASTSTSTASTQPPKDSNALPVASIGGKPVAKDVESEKTESSSEPEIGTESSSDVDTDADDAASESEKTEES